MKKLIPSALAVALIAAVAFLVVYRNNSEEVRESHNANPQSEVSPVASLWIRHTAKSYVFNEILLRNDENEIVKNVKEYSDEINESLGRDSEHAIDVYQVLLESGAVIDSGGEMRAQTDVSKWETGGANPAQSEVSESMSIALEANVVDWCGEPVNGDFFANDYYYLDDGHFETRKEAVADIERHVQCGSGGSS